MTALTYAIADAHGRFDLLSRAIAICESHAGTAGGKLVLLGDFVDRGPQSREIIDLLIAGPARPNWQWTILQGNHEAMMLEVLRSPNAYLLDWWIGNGGGETLRSYGHEQDDLIWPLKVPSEHLAWLDQLPLVAVDDLRIFVHAGVPFDKDVEETTAKTLQWMLYAGGERPWRGAEILPDEAHLTGKHIVHGHEQSEHHPLLRPHRTNLDSFAWYTGALAIGVFDDRQPGPREILWANGEPA